MSKPFADHLEYQPYLPGLAINDVMNIVPKDTTYDGSWRKRGGVGAFMMMARKWDRIEQFAAKGGYDIFQILKDNPGDVMDDVRDMRRYLLLIEAEVIRLSGAQPQPVYVLLEQFMHGELLAAAAAVTTAQDIAVDENGKHL